MFVDVIAATVTIAQSAQTNTSAMLEIARSLRSAADACLGVQRVATGWSVNRVCATATGHAAMDDDNIIADNASSTAQRPGWLDVPVVAAGLLIWARTHQELVLQRYGCIQLARVSVTRSRATCTERRP